MTDRDHDSNLSGPVLLVMRVRDYIEDVGWLHESHPDSASALAKMLKIEKLVEGARMMKEAGDDNAWTWGGCELPFGPGDDLFPCHVEDMSVWFKMHMSNGIVQLSSREYAEVTARIASLTEQAEAQPETPAADPDAIRLVVENRWQYSDRTECTCCPDKHAFNRRAELLYTPLVSPYAGDWTAHMQEALASHGDGARLAITISRIANDEEADG